MTPEEIVNDVLYAGPEKIGYDIKFPRVAILAERMVAAIKTSVGRKERELEDLRHHVRNLLDGMRCVMGAPDECDYVIKNDLITKVETAMGIKRGAP